MNIIYNVLKKLHPTTHTHKMSFPYYLIEGEE
jgi:hypothetical protein